MYCNVSKAHHYYFITVKVAFILLLIGYYLQITPFLKDPRQYRFVIKYLNRLAKILEVVLGFFFDVIYHSKD
jgi:uncharacterized protein YdaU (DUF1376 family)